MFISPYAMHRHPAFWDRPDLFDPERFAPERSVDRPHFAYMPFGGGPRQCIGNTFALTEAQLLLATIAQRYRLRAIPGHNCTPNPLITLRPRGGLPVTLERRSDRGTPARSIEDFTGNQASSAVERLPSQEQTTQQGERR